MPFTVISAILEVLEPAMIFLAESDTLGTTLRLAFLASKAALHVTTLFLSAALAA